MQLILTHNNADFDAVAALLAAHKIYPEAVPVLPKKQNQNVAEFLILYQNGLPFVHWDEMPKGNIERVILVDAQRMPEVRNLHSATPVLVIDHHPYKEELPAHVTFAGGEVGAATTLLAEQIREQHITINSLEATLMALGIYSDTGAMTYGTTTPRDVQAVAWLLEHQVILDTVRRFLSPPLTEEQRQLFDLLMERSETRRIQGYDVVIAYAELDEYIEQVNSVAHRLRDMLDPEAICVLVKMPQRTQLVCRSRSDAVDVGQIAEYFGGGGHPRASAAKITGNLQDAIDQIWILFEKNIKPITRVADLMSYGVQTVKIDQRVQEIIPQLRRIGHEGYPVLDDGQVVGLLSRRDADRAVEHGLRNATVRDVMMSGLVTLSADDSVSTLEQLMVNSGWGQIPVISEDGSLIGIVTRTDLIKHWAKVHPTALKSEDHIDPNQISDVLGSAVSQLVDTVAEFARQKRLNLFMVGGVVRDLLLNRANDDIDFVLEYDAIDFAEHISTQIGGEVHSFRPFGTARWHLNPEVANYLGVELDQLPEHVDFATSRNEFYEHPTALPSVYTGSIKLDLLRRDFTINTLAIQLSPERVVYRLLDFYSGLQDLHDSKIRVLHSLSFVDDPTRILRAVRFEQRLDFTIEPRTAELMQTSRSMLRRITGERVRNELALLLREAQPEKGLHLLIQRGILSAIHPAFEVDEKVMQRGFEKVRSTGKTLPIPIDSTIDLYWHMLMVSVSLKDVPEVCERLVFSKQLSQSFLQAAELVQQKNVILFEKGISASRIFHYLEDASEMALATAMLLLEDLPLERLMQYWTVLRHIKPLTDGDMLRQMGLKPGPQYRIILQRLLDAWLDGEINDENSEQLMREKLVKMYDSI